LVGDAIEAEVFAKRVLAGEEFFLRVGTDYRNAGVSEVVGLAEESAFCDIHFAHAAVRGVHAADPIVRAARTVGDYTILERLRRNALQQRNFSANEVEIVDREANLRSRLGASGLQLSASGKNEDEVGAEGAE